MPRLALLPVVVAALAAAPASAAALRPPVLHETFTHLPCPAKQVSTLDIEACRERDILASDARINALARRIFSLLPDTVARRRFLTGERAWLAYRTRACQSRSDVYEGGTAAGILYAACAVTVNDEHVKDLTDFRAALARR